MGTEQNKISIIIPVYNSQNSIGRCLDSVCAQTYKNIEIIIIDDGSEDNTLKLCLERKEKDERIKVYHQSNSGVSAARNLGIKKSSGKYLQFVDADDEVQDDMCEKLVSMQLEKDADLVICGYTQIYKKEMREVLPKEMHVERLEDFAEFFSYYLKEYLLHTPWNKLYKKSVVEEYFDETYSSGEDFLFNIEFLRRCNRIAGIREALYIYYYEPGNGRFRKSKMELLWQEVRVLIEEKFNGNAEAIKVINQIYIDDVLCNINIMCQNGFGIQEIHKYINSKSFQKAIKESRKEDKKNELIYILNFMRLNYILILLFKIKNIKGKTC